MTRRLLTLLLAGVVGLAGLALAQEPPTKEEPPVRLKKKKPRGDDKPKVDPDKAGDKKDEKKAEKKDDKKQEPRESEPVTPQEEEKEVLQRVVKNVHDVGDRLAKNDVGEATQQTQRDILKDLESLIQRNEDPSQDPNQGGGADQDNQDQQGSGGQQDQKQQRGKAGQKSGKGSAGGKMGQRSQGRGKSGQAQGSQKQNRPGSGSQARDKPRPGGEKNGEQGDKDGNSEKPGGKNGKNGNGGGGGDKDDPVRNRAADQYKDIWGHLPQTLRAQMDAYSNPQPFIPKYDEIIKQYYRTIAEQGRRKGE